MSDYSTIQITISVPREEITSALISGFMFGASWALDVKAVIPKKVRSTLTQEQREWIEEMGEMGFAATTPGCYVSLIECGDGETNTRRRFGWDDVERAIGVIASKYPHHIGTLFNGGDAEVGDVLIQIAALGDIVYG